MVTSADGTVDIRGVHTLQLCDEGVGSHHVQGHHDEDLGWVEDSSSLEDLAGDGIVNGVGDDADHGVGANLGEGGHDAEVDVEQVVTGNTRGDTHNLHSLEGSLQLVSSNKSNSLGLSYDMTEISSHSGSVDHIIEVELDDGRVQL